MLYSISRKWMTAIALPAILLGLTLAPKAFSANPALIANIATPPFLETFASQPSSVVPGTCAHWVVDVTTLRDVNSPRIEISGWLGVQPCRGTTSLRQDYYVGSPGCQCGGPLGNPYWVFPGRLVKNGVVPKGTHTQFTLNEYIPYSSGGYLQQFSFYETGTNNWTQISSAPSYSYVGSPPLDTGGGMK